MGILSERFKEYWEGFKEGSWQDGIDTRDFIIKNFTPYYGDSSFLCGPTERTKKLNEYAARVKAGETLTPEEIADRDRLRQEFLAEFRKNFRAQLDNTVVQYPDGTKKKVERKR